MRVRRVPFRALTEGEPMIACEGCGALRPFGLEQQCGTCAERRNAVKSERLEFARSVGDAARIAAGTPPHKERRAVSGEVAREQMNRLLGIREREGWLAWGVGPTGRTLTAQQRVEIEEELEAERGLYGEQFEQYEMEYGPERADRLRAAVERRVAGHEAACPTALAPNLDLFRGTQEEMIL